MLWAMVVGMLSTLLGLYLGFSPDAVQLASGIAAGGFYASHKRSLLD